MRTELDRRLSLGDVPDALRSVLLDVPWDLTRLLALKLPIGRSDVQSLGWHLELPFWREHGRWFAVSPEAVRRDPAAHPEQWRRTVAADLTFAIHVTERQGRIVVLDGVHRLLKATIEHRSCLPQRFLPPEMIPLIARGP